MKAIEHPCFSCRLPDCNDKLPACALRRAQAKYSTLRKSGQTVPQAVKDAYAIAYKELYGHRDRSARANEMSAR